MSGFCGLYGVNHVRKSELERMLGKIQHRGPDGEAFFVDSGVGLAANTKLLEKRERKRFKICASEDGNKRIVFDGRIYNRDELSEQMGSEGNNSKVDEDLILHLYERYQTEFLLKLNGEFSFVIYDSLLEQIICARDRLGIKPFYYGDAKSNFVFGSEIKAILEFSEIENTVNYDSLAEYVYFQYCLNGKTLFNTVQELRPGHYLIVRRKGNELFKKYEQYWDMNFKVDLDHTEHYFIEKLKYLIYSAISLRVKDLDTIGVLLSGGLDSSAVTCIASSLKGSSLKAFSGGFHEGPEYDETGHAELVAHDVGAEHFKIFPTSEDFISHIEEIIYYLDEPVAGPGSFPQYMVANAARNQIDTVLGGEGGDEIFGGYMRYLVAYLEQCIKGAINESLDQEKYIVTLQSIIPNLSQLDGYQPMLRDFWRSGLFNPMGQRYFKLIERFPDENRLFTKDFASSIDHKRIYTEYKSIFGNSKTASYINKMTYFDIKASLPALLHVDDRVNAAASLEVRGPLLDHRIIELVNSMPPMMKFKGGKSKYIFRKAMEGVIPERIVKRKDKMGFPVPLSEWFSGPLKDFVQDLLLSSKAKSRGIYNKDTIEKLITGERKFGRQLWGLICLEIWFRTFID